MCRCTTRSPASDAEATRPCHTDVDAEDMAKPLLRVTGGLLLGANGH